MLGKNTIKVFEGKASYLKDTVTEWDYSNIYVYPWRKAKSKFHALVAEILLQRTKAEQVIDVYNRFIRTFPSALSLSKASAKEIYSVISSLGLRWRVKLIKKLGCCLTDEYRGKVPEGKSRLLSLPGVGEYVAAAFLSFHCNKRAVIVDANTIRLYGRFFELSVSPETRRDRQFNNFVEKLTPVSGFKKFNYAVLDLSRNVCRQKPRCCICPVRAKCSYKRKDMRCQ